ncbi:MAG: histidine kinase [Cyclobacteriaceae bacterium]
MQQLTYIKREKLYWLFQLAGWSGFFVIQSALALAAYYDAFTWYIVASYFNITIVGFVLTHFYRSYIKRKRWLNLSLINLAIRILLSSVLLGMLWAVLVLPINAYYFPTSEEPLSLTVALILTVNLSIVILSWSMIYFIFQLFYNFKQSEVEKWQLEAAVKDAELIALKSQVNPHFIFNSLNNIRSLVTENPEKAREMITHLSGLLRYSIQFNNKERVSLEDELEIVQNYLNLESIQYEDRLQYKLEIKPETLEMLIPPMAIQLLVENAIKHGISTLPKGGLINVRSYLQKDKLFVEVINTGQLKEGIQGTGIGLRNASDRLKLLFGKLSDLTIQNLNDEFVSASFSIPLKN